MIGSFATSRALPDGGYHGVYKPFYTKEESFVMLDDEHKRVFRDKWEAEAVAWRQCKWVEREHLRYLRADPQQIKEAGRWYDKNTRMKAQAKDKSEWRATAEAVFKRKEVARVDAL